MVAAAPATLYVACQRTERSTWPNLAETLWEDRALLRIMKQIMHPPLSTALAQSIAICLAFACR